MGRFEVASRAYARYLERTVPLLERVAIEPVVKQEFDVMSAMALPRLRELRVFGAAVYSTALASLALLTQVEALSLASSELGDEVFGSVAALTRLTSLECAVMWRMTATSLQALAALPRLERLSLEFCMGGGAGVVSSVCDGRALVENVLALRGLRSLAVNSVVFAGGELGALSALTCLEELRVRDAALHVPSSLAQLSALPRLHTLVLMFSRAPVQVRQLAGLTRLRRLALLGQTAPGELAQLAQLRTLRALAVRRLEAPGELAALGAALAAWRAAPPEQELEEFSCWLAEVDEPGALLAQLPGGALRRLRLSQLEASARLDAAAAALARLGALELLELDQARASDADLARLVAALPRLRRLSLFGCEAVAARTVAAIGASCARLEALCVARILVHVPQHAALGSLAPLAAGCPRLAQLWLGGDRLVDDRELATAPPLALLDIARCPRVLHAAALARALAARHGTRVLLAADDDAQLWRRQRQKQFGFFDEI